MNPDDYAIVIGLQTYPGLANLEGPENDARAFHEWLISPDGGGVPNDAAHVQLILSSHYPLPAPPAVPSVRDAHPVVSEIENAFWNLHTIHLQNVDQRGTPRIGRRLYIYMAGHGIAPTASGAVNQHESVLLMANVNPFSFGPTYQIPGAYTANWFSRNDCFEEVFLFMDCCRGAEWVPGMNAFLPSEGLSDTAKRCYAFSTKWSQNAREKPMPDEAGAVRGVFTKTLLMGLSGGAATADPANPGQGVITADSLRSFLYGNIGKFMAADDAVQEPDIDYWPRTNGGKDIVVKTISLPTFPVVIRPPVGQSGRVRVYTHINNQMKRINGKDPFDADWAIDLPRGLYFAVFDAATEIEINFEVSGTEGMSGIPDTLVTL